MKFVAIDFETATSHSFSICSVGIVSLEHGKIIDEFYSLIQPPDNLYYSWNTKIHGLGPQDTKDALSFPEVYPEIKRRLVGKKILAHNESFDRNVLRRTLEYFEIEETELQLRYPWLCTVKIYRSKMEGRANLAQCCARHNIRLDHHNALSDARACALLYQKHIDPMFFETDFRNF